MRPEAYTYTHTHTHTHLYRRRGLEFFRHAKFDLLTRPNSGRSPVFKISRCRVLAITPG